MATLSSLCSGLCFCREVPLAKRHVYEVIPENSPCRLYFDLEFKKSLNPAICKNDSLRLLETFIQYIGYQVYQHFKINTDRKHVLDLDSRCVPVIDVMYTAVVIIGVEIRWASHTMGL